MKALKKVLLGVLSLACVVTASVGLTACNSAGGTTQEQENTSETTEEQEGTEGLAYYLLPDGTYAVSQGTTTDLEEIVIPSTYKGKAVTMIADNAFEDANLTSIEIPDSVTSIGSSAFSSCDSLTSLVIPDSVTSIGQWAFYYCRRLTSVVIPDSVTSIDSFAFESCDSLTSVVIPDSVIRMGFAFEYCSSLTSIVIPDSVTEIGDRAFYSCNNLTSVVIPDSVTSIGSSAFESCSSLTSIEIPDSVTSIGNFAFHSCSSLVRVCYKGSASDWAMIDGFYYVNLTDATVYYYSESQPTDEGNYWYYDKSGEKLGTIFVHVAVENFTDGYSIYENHAGCERGYFITPTGEHIAIEKYSDRESYKQGDKSKKIAIPDLVLLDLSGKEIINIEGKKYENKQKGIEYSLGSIF